MSDRRVSSREQHGIEVMDSATVERITRKVESLPPVKRAEVENFVDFLHAMLAEREVATAVTRASEPAFSAVWDNEHDAEYDRL